MAKKSTRKKKKSSQGARKASGKNGKKAAGATGSRRAGGPAGKRRGQAKKGAAGADGHADAPRSPADGPNGAGPGRATARSRSPAPSPGVTAETLASRQKEISVSEFFAKNRHLLGFDSPSRALLTAVKEAVDNSLDACEEAEILPEIEVIMRPAGEDRFRVVVSDNGPGIVKGQIPRIFAKLLYGSKFHSRKQSRGQQGIGISAA
ncbi:MAG: ATP-binding protein, partial [Planctomycetota bacterium]